MTQSLRNHYDSLGCIGNIISDFLPLFKNSLIRQGCVPSKNKLIAIPRSEFLLPEVLHSNKSLTPLLKKKKENSNCQGIVNICPILKLVPIHDQVSERKNRRYL